MKKEKKLMIALCVIPLVVLALIVLVLPDQIPLHFNYKGDANRYGSKYFIFALTPLPYLIYITRIRKK
ncbi:putative membrane protein [Clostridium acetobutylicum]|uniref:Hypothetical secreted protein n=1 Tax=Clostridium acetobutylicum (strain ATCC 824 / DSM 792 / JCM 1419 / IAM 19013 / LMG 5710 / NBRC 13948 / NRRL B-527 / VKM B-1787 / 2291 / W) TaxID=272562 RepID=Q97TL5_CLOAB